jgi:putative ABC transport system permease protein
VISLFGTLGGVCLGLFLGWALVEAASGGFVITAFAAPPGQLLIVLTARAIVGVLAADAARRNSPGAAKLNGEVEKLLA